MPHRHQAASPAPSASFSSSDKENRHGSARRVSGQKRGAMEPRPSDNAGAKRRKTTGLAERAGPAASQRAKQDLLGKINKKYYDPDQSLSERRTIRKGLRDLDRELQDGRNEYVAADSTGLHDTVKLADGLFGQVKQTSDAVLDSRLLVKVGDLAVRKAAQLQLGGAAAGVNLDDFISKSITFMRRGPSEADATRIYPPGSTQQQRARQPRRQNDDSDAGSDIEGIDEGDAMDWEWMGRKAAFPYNVRPPVPVFLLGPLSVQKKARKVTQRIARQRLNPEDAVRPDELRLSEIERNENSNLTALCKMILELLTTTNSEACDAALAEVGDPDERTQEEIADIMEKHGVGDDGGTLLCKFAFNPRSFGQTVENLFYISFLIRDARIGLQQDGKGFQTLHPSTPSSAEERAEEGVVKNQGVFHLDYDVWEESVRLFNVTTCVIPHREDSSTQQNVRGWYG